MLNISSLVILVHVTEGSLQSAPKGWDIGVDTAAPSDAGLGGITDEADPAAVHLVGEEEDPRPTRQLQKQHKQGTLRGWDHRHQSMLTVETNI